MKYLKACGFFSNLVTIKLVFHLPPRTDFLIFRCLWGYKLSTLLLTSQSSGIRWKRTAQGMILVRSITTLSPLSYLSVDFRGLMSSSATFIPQNSPHHLHKYLQKPCATRTTHFYYIFNEVKAINTSSERNCIKSFSATSIFRT